MALLQVVAAGDDAHRALGEAIADARGRAQLAPVTVVAASPYESLFLRQRWGARGRGATAGFANLRFVTLSGLARSLGSPALRGRGLRPLTPAIGRAAARTALARGSGRLGRVAARAGLDGALVAAFRRLDHDPAAEARPDDHGRRAELVALRGAYRGIVSRHFDADDLARSAAAAVGSGAPATREAGHVVLYLPGAVSAAEMGLVRALALAGRLGAVLALTGDPVADATTEELADRLAGILGEPRRPAVLPRRASPPPGAPVPTPGGALIVSAPDPEEEVRHVVRRLLHRAAHSDVPLYRMAMLFADPAPYATIAAQVLAESSIPRYGPAATRLAESAAGRALSGLLHLAAAGPTRHETMRWLASAPIVDPATGAAVPVHRWNRLSRRARTDVAGGTDVPDVADLAGFVARLATDLRAPVGSGWSGLSAWAAFLLASYVAAAPDLGAWPASEQEALDRVRDRLDELSRLDEIGAPADLASFTAEVEAELSAPAPDRSHFGEGLFVGPLDAAAGVVLDTVAIVGMAEGRFPPCSTPDPLLPGQSSERGARVVRRAYAMTVASAPHVILSYPRGEPRSGRRRLPCPWLLAAASACAGRDVGADGLLGAGPAPWLDVVASSEAALATALPPSSPAEAELRSLRRWRAAGRPLGAHPLALSEPPLAAGLELVASRASDRLTRFDGRPGDRAGSPMGPSVSATTLERWAECPFRSFLHDVLRVEEVDRDDDPAGFGPADRGVLVHAILAEFIATAPPRRVPSQPWTTEERSLMRRIAERLCAERAGDPSAAATPSWEIERRRIVRSALEFLDADEEARRTLGVVPSPAGVEVGFGGPGDALPGPTIGTPVGPVTLRGRIDRVDRSPDGRRVVVYDYKTGRAIGADPGVGLARGTRLQLPAYALAVGGGGGPDEEVAALYWAVGPEAHGRAAHTGSPSVDPEVRRELEDRVAAITGAMAAGLFPAVPDDAAGRRSPGSRCSSCSYRRLCSANRGASWHDKSSDPAARPYLELSGAADGPQPSTAGAP